MIGAAFIEVCVLRSVSGPQAVDAQSGRRQVPLMAKGCTKIARQFSRSHVGGLPANCL